MKKTMLMLIILVSISTFASAKSEINSIHLDCTFPTYSAEDGLHKDPNFKLEFTHYAKSNSSYLKGNVAIDPVDMVIGGSSVTFIETTLSGNITTTAVVMTGENEGQAVHSRATEVFGKIIPSQYYGTCKIKIRRN